MINISDPGGVPLGRALAVNVTLQVLKLRHNNLSSTTGNVFNAVLKNNNATLKHLDVNNTGLHLQERNELQFLMEANMNAANNTKKLAAQQKERYLHQLRKFFFECDYDGSGTISQDEQWSLYAKMGYDIHSVETQIFVEESWKKMDADGSGDVDIDEFIDLATRMYDTIKAPGTGPSE
jgi:hypothetical protein